MWAPCVGAVFVVVVVVVVVVVRVCVCAGPYQVKGQGVLVEGVHVWEAGLHLGLDVTLLSSCEPDPCDTLPREDGRFQHGSHRNRRLQLTISSQHINLR